ncbi:hypothetical protein [Thalassospira sp. TSL5-1]|uniref:hypothetical protein n=1 Tax=Thalassospira sp. TSL5-1 TaxID=1544451 RepID=UPI00093BA920|nr:hypothetical protein [Thalassospira sp. TSL5-1]OKH88090.1 hypothetical protein LF95_15565 [Thalassospira sp. TSL5-1]
MSRKRLEKPSMLSAFNKSDFIEIGLEGAEGGIDALFNDYVLALIPGASFAKLVLKLPKTLHNRLFERALIGFLSAGDDVDHEEWAAWVRKLEQKDGGLDRAGQILLRTLSAIDDAEKARYLGMIYAAAAKQQITIDDMFRMQMVLDRAYLPDVANLALQVHHSTGGLPSATEAMIFLGLVSREFGTTMDELGLVFYSPTELGFKFLAVISENGTLK